MDWIKKIGLATVIWALTGTLLHAQQRIRLSTGWEFIREDLGSVWEAVRPADPGSPESVPLWDSVALPHCFNARDAVDPDENYYEGPGWYRTRLRIDNPYAGGRTLLHFEGAGQKAQVYVYTEKVGAHVGGYDEWSVDITDAVKRFLRSPDAARFQGKVPVEIRVDNSRDVEMIPSDMSDFTLYGGLYRPLYLEYRPSVSFNVFHLRAVVDSLGKQGEISVRASFLDPGQIRKATVEVTVLDPAGKQVGTFTTAIRPDSVSTRLGSLRFTRPRLWSPDRPALYTVRATLRFAGGEARIEDQVGFRHFRFQEHGPFYLNGKRLLLQGTHRHQDAAGVGAAETDEMVRREFDLMKAMGVNFIRLAHYQQAPLVLHLCDSLGILVWEEIPWCRGGLGGDAYREQARRMLTDMITQHYNHPAVILWSVGNEIDWPGDFPSFSKDSIRSFVKTLNDLAHRLDPDRLTALRRCDFARDLVDVYSPSIWAGWYGGRYTEYLSATRTQMKRVDRFFHAEWGADSHAGRHAEDPYLHLGGVPTGKGTAEKAGDASLTGGSARVSRDGDWSETYQCDLIDWYLKEQLRMPELTGSAYWIFKDFATPLRPENPIPYVNQKGVVERDLTPKEAYYVFQSYWTSRPMAHIYGHTWPVRWGKAGKAETFKVYSNCPEAELFVNGKSQGVRKRDPADFPAAGLRWEVPLEEGDYRVRVVAKKGGARVTDSIAFHYQTASWGKPARLLLHIAARSGDTTTVEARAVDASGVPCLDAANFVRFSAAGAGTLIDDLGTPDGSRKIQLYNGRARIRVRTPGGESAVAVDAQDLTGAVLLLGKQP